MERHKTASQVSIDRKHKTLRDSSVVSINEQNDIDKLIQHDLLDAIVEYDSKLNFTCVPIVTHDQVLKHFRRQTYGLIWNSIRLPLTSKLVQYDRSCAFVEILRTPSQWSRYDADVLLLKIRQKNFLNGLALRDEFVRILQIILQRDFNTKYHSSYKFSKLDFTRNTIQLTFHSQREPELTLSISLVLLIEFKIPSTTFSSNTYSFLIHHHDFEEYFKNYPDAQLIHLTPSNSIKFQLDYSLTEAKLCNYLLQQSTSLSTLLTSFLKLRKQWLKFIPRAVKHVVETTTRKQTHSDRYRSSTCSITSLQSVTSNTSELLKHHVSFSTELEVAFESLFSTPLLRLLFLTVCSKYKQFVTEHDNHTAYAIDHALQIFADALETNYLEHPFLRNINILPDAYLTCEANVQVGIKKIINEMRRDWK